MLRRDMRPFTVFLHDAETDSLQIQRAADLPRIDGEHWSFTDLHPELNDHNGILGEVARYAGLVVIQDTLLHPEFSNDARRLIAESIFSSSFPAAYYMVTKGEDGLFVAEDMQVESIMQSEYA